MRHLMTIAAVCVLGAGMMTGNASAAEYDYNYTSCIDGVCTEIPIVQSVPTSAVLVGEFYRPQVTYDANGHQTSRMVLVRRYALHGHQYRPCTK